MNDTHFLRALTDLNVVVGLQDKRGDVHDAVVNGELAARVGTEHGLRVGAMQETIPY